MHRHCKNTNPDQTRYVDKRENAKFVVKKEGAGNL